MRSLVSRLHSSLIALALVALGPIASAQTPAYTIDNVSTPSLLSNPPFTMGFAFNVQAPITVYSLGIFDGDQDGLISSYEVGLFDPVGTLIASVTVPSGNGAILVNQFRYVDLIAPVVLLPGNNYTLGALYLDGVDPVLFPGEAIGFVTHPSIQFVESRFASGGTLAHPTSSISTLPGYLGPNMLLERGAGGGVVPEPGAVALMISLGGAGLLALRRRVRK
ncbi:MAG: PEP-CTERM sorting domain-containing protein [Chloroherpetonaceae bacterium]|nr:PEP-CTERM sorting domain-containing protein [Chthonomonadaceae bacterium]MDW8208606.1 PEP-CTERM sorting domain-containing protein [Chloroherpetonaceae bacterium]